MRGFWFTYGKTVLSLLLMLLFAAGLGALISKSWEICGTVAETGGQTMGVKEKDSISFIAGKPLLYAKSVRVIQGEELLLSSLATAKDVDGENLDSMIRFIDEKGNTLHNEFDTSEPGCYSLKLSVRSSISGKTARKTIMVLVDGRVL